MHKMLFLLLFAVITVNVNAQCSFDFTVTGDSITVSYHDTLSPFFEIDSVAFEFGDGGAVTGVNTPPNSIFNYSTSHHYAANGFYVVCMLEYTSWGGSPQTPCLHCDTIAISGASSCLASAGYASSSIGLDVNFIDSSTCASCISTTYFWDFGDGSNSTLQSPFHPFAFGGTYNVCLFIAGSSVNGGVCMDTICNAVSVVGVGINSLQTKTLNYYPNPVSESVTVVLPDHSDNMNITLQLNDVAGRIVWSGSSMDFKNGAVEIDMHLFANGFYFLKMISNEGIYEAKLIKE